MNIGVGSGYLEEIIKQAGWEIYSPDPNEKTINRLNEEGMKGYIGYIEHIPFHDEMFDIVVASELLEHLDDKQRLMGLSEIVRILKRGGLFIGTVRYKETLVDNEAVCPKCGEKFHRWGRKKSFNINELRKELSSFFVITELKRTVFRNTGINYVVRDLLMVKNLVGARLSDVSLDLVGYFMCDYRELLMM